jgi:hypothetical protein
MFQSGKTTIIEMETDEKSYEDDTYQI